MIRADLYSRFPLALFIGLVLCTLLKVSILSADLPIQSAHVPLLDGKLEIDGFLNESVWETAQVLSPLVKNGDGSSAVDKTLV